MCNQPHLPVHKTPQYMSTHLSNGSAWGSCSILLQSPPGISSPNIDPKKEGTDMVDFVFGVMLRPIMRHYHVTGLHFDLHTWRGWAFAKLASE